MIPFAPPHLGASLWLDGADSAARILSGSTVVQWSDKIGSNHFTPPSPWVGPPVSAGALNGLDMLSFVGASNHRLSGVKPTGDLTLFCVLQRAASAPNSVLFGDTSSSTTRFAFAIENATTATWNSAVTSPVGYLNGAAVTATRKTWYDALNGAAAMLAFSGDLSQWGATLGLGGYANTTASSWKLTALFGELIGFQRLLTTTEIAVMFGYLAHRWGLAGLLPSGHAYKTTPPWSYAIAGTVITASGGSASRNVLIYDESTDQLLQKTTCNAQTGAFQLGVFAPASSYRLIFTGEPGKNDLVLRGIVPV